MSLKFLFLFILSSSFLFSLGLKNDYKVEGLDFNASHIDPSIKNDFLIYHFEENRHQKTFTSSKLLLRLQNEGMNLEDETKGLVHVKRNSKIDYSSISNKIKTYYHTYYPQMFITDIKYLQNTFIQDLGKDYTLKFKNKAYLYQRASLQLFSANTGKRHFITYELEASLKVFKASHNINRGKLLTPLDLRNENIVFKRFKGLPVQMALKGRLRLKKRLVEGKVVYLHDIEKLPDVLKNKEVNVRYISGNVQLEFIAISLEDGYISEEINIKKRDGKRLKARVISPNLVEIK
ncbi:MAG TPA: flagellar basal body P-ring formation protein FlgA [Sulfurimonas sp.]|nr:flagellar basal body P-ring formation protein FlgA [Sulfurimonas sp.]